MSRVRERILPVQDSRCPQDATLTGEGAQNLQDQMLKTASRSPGPRVTLPPPPEGPEATGDSGGQREGLLGPSPIPDLSPGSRAHAELESPARSRDPSRPGGSPRTRLKSWPKGGTHVAEGKLHLKKKTESSAEPQRRLSQKYYFFYCYFIRFLYYFFFSLTI